MGSSGRNVGVAGESEDPKLGIVKAHKAHILWLIPLPPVYIIYKRIRV
jgi:hypothetical protein